MNAAKQMRILKGWVSLFCSFSSKIVWVMCKILPFWYISLLKGVVKQQNPLNKGYQITSYISIICLNTICWYIVILFCFIWQLYQMESCNSTWGIKTTRMGRKTILCQMTEEKCTVGITGTMLQECQAVLEYNIRKGCGCYEIFWICKSCQTGIPDSFENVPWTVSVIRQRNGSIFPPVVR